MRYCNASSSVGFSRNVKTEYNYVNVLSIIATLSPLPSCCCCRSLVVIVVVLFATAAYFCRRLWRQRLLVIFVGVSLSESALASTSELASCCCRCIIHRDDGVPNRGYFLRLCHLIVIFVVSVLSLSLVNYCSRWRRRPFCWLIFSASAPHHSCCQRRLVVAVCVPLSLAASHRRYLCQLLVVVISVVSSLSVPGRCLCFVVFYSGVPYCVCFRRLMPLVVIVVARVLLSLLVLLSLVASRFFSSLSASRQRHRRRCHWQRLVIVVSGGRRGVL